jgi:hypothetical protein
MEMFELRKQIYSFTLNVENKSKLDKIVGRGNASLTVDNLIQQFLKSNKKKSPESPKSLTSIGSQGLVKKSSKGRNQKESSL